MAAGEAGWAVRLDKVPLSVAATVLLFVQGAKLTACGMQESAPSQFGCLVILQQLNAASPR